MSQSTEFTLCEVPRNERKGLFPIFIVMFSFTFFVGTMFAGGKVGMSFSFWDMLWVAVVGNILLAAYAGALAFISARSGLSAVLMGRFCFGEVGCKLSDFALCIAELGWYAWGTATLANSLCSWLGWQAWSAYPLMVLLGLSFCITAIVGFKGLNVLSCFSVPLMMALLVVAIIKATQHAGGWQALTDIAPLRPMDCIVFGTFASGATQSTNWSRLARCGRAAVAASFLSFFAGNGLMIIAGGWCGIVYQNADIVDVMMLQGLSLMAIVMLCLNLWTIQGPTIYNVAAAACHLMRTDRRVPVTLLSAVVGILLAVAGISELLVPFLKLLGVIIPPIGGVIMADFWGLHHGRYPRLEDVTLPNFNIRGLLAYAIGAVLSCLSPWVAPVVGIAAAAVAYIVLGLCGVNCKKGSQG